MAYSDDLPAIYQDVILGHNRNPRNLGDLPEATHHWEGFSRLCGETLTVRLVVDADHRIASIRYRGEVSAVAMASASLMSLRIEGRPQAQVIRMCQQYQAFLEHPDQAAADWIASDPELSSFSTLRPYRSRLAAALLAWRSCEQALLSGCTGERR